MSVFWGDLQDQDWEVVENTALSSSPKTERNPPHEVSKGDNGGPKGEGERTRENGSPKPPPRTKRTVRKEHNEVGEGKSCMYM